MPYSQKDSVVKTLASLCTCLLATCATLALSILTAASSSVPLAATQESSYLTICFFFCLFAAVRKAFMNKERQAMSVTGVFFFLRTTDK